jgi:hypothetical protein
MIAKSIEFTIFPLELWPKGGLIMDPDKLDRTADELMLQAVNKRNEVDDLLRQANTDEAQASTNRDEAATLEDAATDLDRQVTDQRNRAADLLREAEDDEIRVADNRDEAILLRKQQAVAADFEREAEDTLRRNR